MKIPGNRRQSVRVQQNVPMNLINQINIDEIP